MAQDLAKRGYGVLEPFQTKASVPGQIEELREALEQSCQTPVTLIGWSWGAWLSCFLAAKYPSLVARLILVASAPLQARYAEKIMPTRLSRLTDSEQAELISISSNLDDPANLRRMMQLFEIADTFMSNKDPHPEIVFDKAIHKAVWAQAAALRHSGELLKIIATIRCPVIALHGDHDPHPAEGVETPLRLVLPKSDFILFGQCGHKPWQEVYARDTFYSELEKVIRQQSNQPH